MTTQTMKVLGVCVLLFSVGILVFAGMAYFELHAAATSPTAPSADSMPLTKILGPELFDPGSSGTKPAELAETIFKRIYALGGVGIFLAALAVLMLAMPQSRSAEQNAS